MAVVAPSCADQGTAEGFGALFDIHHRRAYRLALLLTTGETALAEDVVSEAFACVYSPWLAGRVNDFWPYLRRAVVNQVNGTFRRRAVQRREQERRRGGFSTVHSHEDGITEQDALWRALRALPVKQRTAVALHYLEDQPVEEVARLMGTHVGTAKSQLSRGRSRLAELLRDQRDD